MRLRTWLVAALGLASLVVLIALSMLASSRRAQEIYTQLDELNNHHGRVEATLRALRSDVHLSSIFIRDYLLDVARERAPEYRARLSEFRKTNMAALAELKALTARDEEIASLEAELDEYWSTFDPLFDWAPEEKVVRSAAFLRREVMPRREAVLSIAQEIEELNNANLASQRHETTRRQTALQENLRRLLWQTVLLGMAVSLVVVARLRVLEQRSDATQREIRALSHQMVHTQEEERKNLSRELHDHVAQVLTGLRMELGRIERANPSAASGIAECKELVDEMFGTVRNLALGLRPSMLDDFGLQAALEWHTRDLMSRFALNVDLKMDGDFDALSDKHRTCLYRVVQEATTNAVRHARAANIHILVVASGGQLQVTIADDGIGLDPARRGSGLGLRGIEERVRELAGTMTISRQAGGGTRLAVRLPMPAAVPEAPLESVAG